MFSEHLSRTKDKIKLRLNLATTLLILIAGIVLFLTTFKSCANAFHFNAKTLL